MNGEDAAVESKRGAEVEESRQPEPPAKKQRVYFEDQTCVNWSAKRDGPEPPK